MHYWDVINQNKNEVHTDNENECDTQNDNYGDLGNITRNKEDNYEGSVVADGKTIRYQAVDYTDTNYAIIFESRISRTHNTLLQKAGAKYNAKIKIKTGVFKGYTLPKNEFKSYLLIDKVLTDSVFNENYDDTQEQPQEQVEEPRKTTPKAQTQDTGENNDAKQDLKKLIESLDIDFGIDASKVTKIVREEIAKMPNAAPIKIVYELPYVITPTTSQGNIPNFQKIVDDVRLGNNVYLRGGAGTGKTYLTKQIADSLGQQIETINCSQWTAPTEIIGGQTLDGYQEGKMIEAFRRGNLLLLDELPKLDPNTAGLLNEALAKTGDGLKFIEDKDADFEETRVILEKNLPKEKAKAIADDAKNKTKSAELLYLEIENAVLLEYGVKRVKDLNNTQLSQYHHKLDELMIQIYKYPLIQNNRKERFVKHPYFSCIGTGNIYPNTTSAAYGANNKQDLSLLDRFAGSVYLIEKNEKLEQDLVGIRWLWKIWSDLRSFIEDQKWESQVSIRIMQASLRAYMQEMERKNKKDTNIDNGKTLKDVIHSFITSGFTPEQTEKMKKEIKWDSTIASYQYRYN